ncbi:MAG: diguanylate cyclase [Undibacterium sp.]|nr:diguanylate cyclase [Undibacterium sp.]
MAQVLYWRSSDEDAPTANFSQISAKCGEPFAPPVVYFDTPGMHSGQAVGCHAPVIQARYARARFPSSGVAMLRLHVLFISICALALSACVVLYATAGALKPIASWHGMDIVGEGGTALMAGVWCLMTLSSRPKGLVTRLLAGGLAAIMLGAWVDCLDEFFLIPKDQTWDNWLEAIFQLGGMGVLTAGMYYWRQEQFSLNEQLQKRERLFRDHRAFDRITQLTNADYLRAQIRLEQARHPGVPCAVALLDIDHFHLINRAHGKHEGDRVLQAVCHMLLLNIRNEDLLCRYAGDRFALLMPGTDEAGAREVAQHLCTMVAQMRHQVNATTATTAATLALSLRHACAVAEGEAAEAADTLLSKLSRAIETRSQERRTPAGLAA